MSDVTKILAIGDPHFKTTNSRDTDSFVISTLRIVDERQPDLIIVLGDILDRHETIHQDPLDRATSFLWELARRIPNGRLGVLIGNHDRPNNSIYLTTQHPFNSLKYWSKEPIISDVTKVTIVNGHKFVLVPYVPPGRFHEALTTVDWKQSRVIFAHQEFFGAKMGAIRSEIGDRWNIDQPLVVSGHIHDYDLLQDNVLYTGTPIQHAFGDREDKSLTWITVTDTNINHERIMVEGRKKRSVALSAMELTSYVPPQDTDLRIIITGTPAELKIVHQLDTIKGWAKEGVKIVYKASVERRPTDGSPGVTPEIRATSFTDHLIGLVARQPDLVPLFNQIMADVHNNPK